MEVQNVIKIQLNSLSISYRFKATYLIIDKSDAFFMEYDYITTFFCDYNRNIVTSRFFDYTDYTIAVQVFLEERKYQLLIRSDLHLA